ncbi:MAG: phosphoenolpyruvate--protein phosphotransferase [Candidatus Coatesbacteria bacterium]|nr:phosphoenolpyruvate--protein phosphotransferase [Candidatus Coatesbacteria bacterium]
MKIYKGIGVSPGIAIGNIYLLEVDMLRMRYKKLTKEESRENIELFKEAIRKTREDLLKIRQQMMDYGNDIFIGHLRLLDDPVFIGEVIKKAQHENTNIEYLFSIQLKEQVNIFKKMDNQYFKERATDLQDVGRRLIQNFMGADEYTFLENIKEDVVIIAHELPPSFISKLQTRHIIGFATEVGSWTSHTAIIARALTIPAVVGLEGIAEECSPGDRLLIDGVDGVVIYDPDSETLKDYDKRRSAQKQQEKRIIAIARKPALTRDREKINILANIEIPQEVNELVRFGAEGIGLYRTEFLFMSRNGKISEDEQYLVYREIASRMYPKPVTIRTLDLGGDKFLHYDDFAEVEKEDVLGLRAIRFCLHEPQIFMSQLKAILRAAYSLNVKMMFPLISEVNELKQALEMLNEAKNQLMTNQIPFNSNLKVGIMIEVPSAVMLADHLARMCDFFSIGTNDLIQYSLAVNRVNKKVAYLYDPLNPAILKLIYLSIQAALKAGIEISMCGEMASDPWVIWLLLAMGLRDFSVSPKLVGSIKEYVSQVDIKGIERNLQKALSCATGTEVRELAEEIVLNNKLPIWQKK